MARTSSTTCKQEFADVGKTDVFMPADWMDWPGSDPKRHYILSDSEPSAALRVRFKGGKWQPFDDRPLMDEHSFFPPEEPVLIVAHYRR